MYGRAVASHADNIAAVRVRFTAVTCASAAIARDSATYGLLCRWITETFEAKHVRQNELFEFVDDNLRLIGESLCGETKELDPVRVAATPSLVASVEAKSCWQPLREVLDQLTGKPEVIASHAVTWYNMAVELRCMADDLDDFVEYDIAGWHGAKADEHRRLMANNIEAIKGLSSVSAALGEITESVGVLVAQTRRIVHDVVIELARLAVSTAWQEWTFARWAHRIAVYAVALDTTLTHLGNRLNG